MFITRGQTAVPSNPCGNKQQKNKAKIMSKAFNNKSWKGTYSQ